MRRTASLPPRRTLGSESNLGQCQYSHHGRVIPKLLVILLNTSYGKRYIAHFTRGPWCPIHDSFCPGIDVHKAVCALVFMQIVRNDNMCCFVVPTLGPSLSCPKSNAQDIYLSHLLRRQLSIRDSNQSDLRQIEFGCQEEFAWSFLDRNG